MQSTNKFFHLIDGTDVIGDVEASENPNEILIKNPYTIKAGKMIPYMIDVTGEQPKALLLMVMNILWFCPLDEFEEINKAYIEINTGITMDTKLILD